MYAPVVKSANTQKLYTIGEYDAALMDNITAEGPVEYEYIIAVFERDNDDPFLFVTSERNDPGEAKIFFEEMGLDPEDFPVAQGESHFLCLFDESGHKNLGDSNDWADIGKFEKQALIMLEKILGTKPTLVEEKKSTILFNTDS